MISGITSHSNTYRHYVNKHVVNRHNKQNRISSSAATREYLDNLKLHSLVSLRALEAVADGFHQPVDEPLARGPAVRSVARDVAIRNQLLLGGGGQTVVRFEQQSVMSCLMSVCVTKNRFVGDTFTNPV